MRYRHGMATATNGKCEIYYESFGDPGDPTLMLVNGLGSQCINYHEDWCEMFVARGLRVVRFDNRDVGLSSKFDDAPVAADGTTYNLSDMAADTLGEFYRRCEPYFSANGRMIDQEYQERLPEGMIRCYLVHDKVVGFGHQAINALFPAPFIASSLILLLNLSLARMLVKSTPVHPSSAASNSGNLDGRE